ncbi:hypothetical protein [Streptomyces sp. TE5632]
MTLLTSSVTALHVYLAVLSAAALFGVLIVWRRLLPAPVIVLADTLFTTLWITLFYGPQAMPSLWVAFGVMLTVGAFSAPSRASADGGPRRDWERVSPSRP